MIESFASRNLKSWRFVSLISALLPLPALIQIIQVAQENFASDILRSKWMLLITPSLFSSLLGAVLFALSWTRRSQQAAKLQEQAKGTGGFSKILLAGFLAGVLIVIGVVLLHPYFGGLINRLWIKLLASWWVLLIVASLVKIFWKTSSWPIAFTAAALIEGICYRLVYFIPAVTTFPFSLDWSETSRYYYSSLLFAKEIYGKILPLSIWHPTRYFLQSIPFLIGKLPLWAHRLWQVLLWLGLTTTSGVLLSRRLKVTDKARFWMFAAWFFLYLFQGSVYYHLQICILIILLGVSSKHPWRSLLAVLAASFWAGISRINWFPVPAMLAAALYFIEEPVTSQRSLWRYLVIPAQWLVLGLSVAFLSQGWYVSWSHNADNLLSFGSSLTSDLLWDRLLPNATFAPGIILAILLVSLPLWGVVFYSLHGRLNEWHPVRLAGLAAILFVLFAGGLVVSVKIGGGGDLHNMDAYLVLLGIIASVLFFERQQPEAPAVSSTRAMPRWLIVLALAIPLVFSISDFAPLPTYDYAQAQRDLSVMKDTVERTSQAGGEVLFISQRHLLTFGEINTTLVPEYELIALMEMAISHNSEYLARFNGDLGRHRFALIVVGKQQILFKGRDLSLSEENNAWVESITMPLLCEYQPLRILSTDDIELLVPRQDNQNCNP
jgi:hypothetical protein